MNTLKISAISYLNTVPFVYGIKHSGFLNDYLLEFDVPARCAEKLIGGSADIGIVPVAAIPQIRNAEIITNYCIGGVGKVQTVIMVAHQPLEKIEKVYLDTDSRTSAMLCRILSKLYWKKNFNFIPISAAEIPRINENEALVLIGDKTFNLDQQGYYTYLDLAEEWLKFTNLPFVFACWVCNRKIPAEQIQQFDDALRYGLDHRPEAIAELDNGKYEKIDIHNYLMNMISYNLDESKKRAMKLFFKYLDEL